ncbi:hypothetical protein PVK06_045496 [Gossypium arboreum]|uniref:Uncharacterized protein n=1 Tax=Gossypium arboreum TaxID=29729 RepID=A0ABR0MWT7_GOSAR|nr:hypothetical protein PVK06_045496 [Gossypium arboreum]
MPVSLLIRFDPDLELRNYEEFSFAIATIKLIVNFKTMIEVEPPSPLRYIIGAAVMMIGVVLPVGYMMFRNKRVPSSSSYSKQT